MAQNLTKINYQQIIEDLEQIQFDKQKHQSLKEAMSDILNQERYMRVMNDTTGIITHSEDANMLKKIIEAYHRLKNYDNKILFSVLQEETAEDLDEFVVLHKNGISILKKNNADEMYQTVYQSKEKIKEEKIYISGDNIYNLQGKCIYEKPIVYYYFVTDNLLCITPKENLLPYYHDENTIPNRILPQEINEITGKDCGNFQVYVSLSGTDTINSSENIRTVVDGLNDLQKERFIKSLSNGKTFPFLEQKVQFCKDGYICTTNKEKLCYYNDIGDKLLDSDQDNYFFIDDKFEVLEDKRHIIIVGKIGKNLNRYYGYYDLDNKCEIGTISYSGALPWMGYGGCVIDSKDNIFFIDSQGKSYLSTKSQEDNFPLKSIGRYYRVKDYIADIRDNYDFNKCYYIAHSLKKIQENIYILKYRYKASKEYEYKYPEKAYALFQIQNGQIPKISKLYHHISLFSLRDKIFLATKSKNGEVVKLTFDGKEMPINFSKATLNPIDSSVYPTNESLQNSLFLEESYKKILQIPSSEIKKKKQEMIATHKQYLETLQEISFESCAKTINSKIQNLWFANQEGLAILRDSDNYILYQVGGNFFAYGNAVKDCALDKYEHIIIEFKYNHAYRQILIDKAGKMLIGLSKKIELKSDENNDYYIVTRCDEKKQAFDINAVPLTIPCDDIQFINKYYVTKGGRIQRIEKRMSTEMCGYSYLLDDDKDYIIHENTEYKEVLEEAKKLALLKQNGEQI